jgi:hypothetical protein
MVVLDEPRNHLPPSFGSAIPNLMRATGGVSDLLEKR